MMIRVTRMAEDQSDSKGARLLPIELLGAEDVRLTYVDAVFVNYTADDMSIAFFQTKRPPLTDEQLASLTSLPATCVTRVVLPVRVAEHLRDVLSALISRVREPKAQS